MYKIKERFKSFLFNVILKSYWKVGFIETPNIILSKEDLRHIRWVRFPYRKKWYADPFILSVHDNILSLLVEEFDYVSSNGVISLLEVDMTDGSIRFDKRLLELDTHLSFPAVLRINGQVYIYPENSRSGCTSIYLFDMDKKEMIDKQVLINKPLSDAIILKTTGDTYIFATSGSHKNGSIVEIYRSSSGIFETYELSQTIELSENTARNGGDFIKLTSDTILKVSQENNSIYGHAIVFQKLVEENGQFSLEELSRINPFEKKMIGVHTYNRFNCITVIDARYYMYPFIGKAAERLISIFHRW